MKGIYLISNPVGSIYIGQSHCIPERFREHRRSVNRLKAHKSAIRESLIKHGVDNHIFSILHELPKDVGQNIMDEYEQFCIDQYREAGFKMLNLRGAGSRGKLSEEAKLKVSTSLTGKKQSKETVQKRKESINRISENNIKEQREKMSLSAKTFYDSEKGVEYRKILSERIINYNKKPRSEHHLKRLSESHKWFKPTKDSLIKKSNSLKKYWANLTPEQKQARISLIWEGRLKNKHK